MTSLGVSRVGAGGPSNSFRNLLSKTKKNHALKHECRPAQAAEVRLRSAKPKGTDPLSTHLGTDTASSRVAATHDTQHTHTPLPQRDRPSADPVLSPARFPNPSISRRVPLSHSPLLRCSWVEEEDIRRESPSPGGSPGSLPRHSQSNCLGLLSAAVRCRGGACARQSQSMAGRAQVAAAPSSLPPPTWRVARGAATCMGARADAEVGADAEARSFIGSGSPPVPWPRGAQRPLRGPCSCPIMSASMRLHSAA